MGIRILTVTMNDDKQTIDHDGHKNFSALEVIGIAEYLRIKGVTPFFTEIEPAEFRRPT